MTAQEMFEKLGLKQTNRNNIGISYEDLENEERYFAFYFRDRKISIGSYDITL